jgi:beta-lactamase regulating signal transducer with metallopeptidase domain
VIAALVDHLWQSTLFALTAGLLTLPLRRAGAGVRYGLWLAASVKFLVPFSLLAAAVARLHLLVSPPHGWAMIAPMVEPMTASLIATVPATLRTTHAVMPAHPTIALPFDPAPVLLGVWALGLAGLLSLWAVRWSRVRAALRAASPMDLAAPVPVRSSPVLFEPGVVGVRRPVLVLPEGIAERLSPDELEAVLAHELCHVRRRDNLTGLVHMLVEALFWFHPLVWWLGARLVDERERACDEAVIRAGHDRDAYARGILETCRLYLQSPLVCVAGASGSSLEDRVEAIMTRPLSMPLSPMAKALLGAAGALALASPVAAGVFAGAQTDRLESAPPQPVQPPAAFRTPAAPMRVAAAALQAAPAADAPAAAPSKPLVAAQAPAATGPATADPSPEETVRLLAEQQQPRRLTSSFDPAHFDRYVGYYELRPNAIFHISRDGGKFLTQLTGQSSVEVYPESETKFFATVVAAQISFVVDSQGRATGLILHQGGREMPAPRIDEATAQSLAARLAQHIISNTPSPGTAEFLRRFVESMEAGAPDHSQMTLALAQVARAQQDGEIRSVKAWGALQSIRFNGVTPQGLDRYLVVFKNAEVPVVVGPAGPDGKFDTLGFTPPDLQRPSPAEIAVRVHSNRPSLGTEASVRKWLVSLEEGQPNYDDMTGPLAVAAHQQWPQTSGQIKAFGPLKEVRFLRVDPQGHDVYEADFQNSKILVLIDPLTADGKVANRSWLVLP